MVLWLLVALLLNLLNDTHQQVRNAPLIESNNQDRWPKTSSIGTSQLQPNDDTREHLRVLTSYNISTLDKILTTDSQTLWPFNEDRHTEESFCSQPWFYPKKTTNGSAICECSSALGWIVKCPNETQLQVLTCYCMTYNEDSAVYVVGLCFYACFVGQAYYTIPSKVNNATELNKFLCGSYHRDGQLCGKCEPEFAPSVYSYSSACTECSNYTMNWIKYIAVAFLPLTLFLGVIVVFRLSVTSGLLNGFVLVTQLYSAPAQLRYLTRSAHASHALLAVGKIVSSLYGCWNLDFFRMFYPPFCLHPRMTTIQAFALDYVLAIYPLVLLGVIYVFVELHDHGCG